MYFKTATILAWFFGAYSLLLFVFTSWWAVVPLAVVLGLAIAAIGFNIQHDAAHKGYSSRKWVNKMFAMTLDLIGGSSFMWDWKHNAIHHTYTNIAGHDDDINIGFLGRLAPDQPRYWFHRLQGVYLWLLYGFLAIKWHLFDDFYQICTGRIGGHKIPRPKGKDLVVFIAGKVVFLSMAFVIPMLLHPVWAVLAVYALAAFVSGVVLSVVFQLAHCVQKPRSPCRLPCPMAVNRSPRMVGPPGRDHRGFLAEEPHPLLVPRRAQFSDRAPPVPQDLSHSLPGPFKSRRGDMPGVRREVFRPPDIHWRGGFAL